MDQKPWLWKKRSTEKTLAADKANNSVISHEQEEENEEYLVEKARLERDLRILSDKLSSALSECSSKDNIAKKQVKIAQEAIAGWEKAERESISLQKDLDKALQQKAVSEERLSHLDAALKECMQQLHFVREEQEKRVHSAVVKTSEEHEKARISLDEKLSAAGKRIAKLEAENIRLNKALLGKDKTIEELSKYKSQVEADLNALMSGLESTQKENGSLKYEVRVLEKELDIRNEEREFTRRTADVAQKQQVESAKKIAKLESECQRLRLLVQKRLLGPAALAKMKNEAEMLGKEQFESRRRRSNPSVISSMDFRADVAGDAPTKRINFLTEQLNLMEEENRTLKYALHKKSSLYARTASRLSRGDGQVEESLKGQLGKNTFFLQENSVVTLSEVGSDDKASCADSWASALLSELENFKSEKQLATPSHRYMGTSDMNLMDDFAEMEKLAEVSVDYPPESSHHSSDEGNAVIGQSEPLISSKEIIQSENKGNGNNISNHMSITVHKILELLEGINVIAQDDKVLPCKNSATLSGYVVRTFQWKAAELSDVLQQFVQTCNDLLNGAADFEHFAQQVASSMDWVMNHCFSLQDVSSMKDAIRIRLDWDESRSESEVESGSAKKLSSKGELFKISKSITDNSELEMEKTESKRTDGDQTEKHEMMKDYQKISNVEHEQQETRNDLKSPTSKEVPEDGKQLRNDWEITAASEKLAACQETILNLGKQLKALSSPRDAAFFDKVISAPADAITRLSSTPQRSSSRRLSLLDNMRAEDNDQIDGSPKKKKNDIQNAKINPAVSTNSATETWDKFTDPNGIDRDAVASMAIVHTKKSGGRGFLKKLFWRHRRSKSKKSIFS